MPSRLRLRLTIVLAAAATVPLLLVGGAALVIASRALDDAVGARMGRLAYDAMRKVELFLAEPVSAVARESARVELARMARSGAGAGLAFSLDALLARHPSLDAAVVLSPSAGVLALPSRGRDGRPYALAPSPFLSTRQPWWRSVTARRRGECVVHDWGPSPLAAAAHRSPSADAAHRNPKGFAVHVSAPLRDSDGELAGVLLCAVNWFFVQDLLDDVEAWHRSQEGRTGVAYAWMTAEPSGLVIAHPSERSPDWFGRSYWGLRAGADLGEARLPVLAKGGHGVALYDWAGRFPRLDGYARVTRLPLLEGQRWVVWAGADRAQLDRPISRLKRAFLAGALLVFALVTAVAFWFAGRLSRPLSEVSSAMGTISEGRGDLTRRLPVVGQDEVGMLGRSFNAFLDYLHGVIQRVRQLGAKVASQSAELSTSSEQLALSSHEIAKNVQEVAGGLGRQAQRAQELSQIVSEMVSGVRQVAQLASETAQLAARAIETAKFGGDSVSTAVVTMNAVHEASLTASSTFRDFERRSAQIGQVIETISAIADQTNLLALNAAIEAARAGEAGKGFAVVADEVRKLAESAAAAVREIAEVIRDVQGDLTTALRTTGNSAADIAQGREVVSLAGQSLEEVVATAQRVSQQMAGISQATSEQVERMTVAAKSVDEIANLAGDASASTEQMAAAVEQQTASIEQLAATAAELSRVSSELRSLLGQIRLKE